MYDTLLCKGAIAMLKHYCPHQGCEELIDINLKHCEKHTDDVKQYDKYRGTSSSRGYNYDWQRVRTAMLRRTPLCEDCAKTNIITIASEVHHIVKVRDDKTKRLDVNNLLCLCKSCHSQRTARGE